MKMWQMCVSIYVSKYTSSVDGFFSFLLLQMADNLVWLRKLLILTYFREKFDIAFVFQVTHGGFYGYFNSYPEALQLEWNGMYDVYI